jgi:hypothetical protein
MNTYKVVAIIFCCVLSCAVFLPAARADQWDQRTRMTFSRPIEIPGSVLPAGTYWFVLLSSDSDRDVVQVFSEDWSHLYATLQTIPVDRQQTKGETEIRLAERPYGQPEALLEWYYPGLLAGHEFLYSGQQNRQLARAIQQDVMVGTAGL